MHPTSKPKFILASFSLLLILIALSWGLSAWSVSPVDPDLGWHLLGGRFVATTGGVPQADFINAFNLRWHDYHWLAQLMFWRVFEFGGFTGLQLGLALVMAGLGVTLALTCITVTQDKLLQLVFLIGAFILIDSVTSVRPQMISFLVIALAQLIIIKKLRFELLAFFFGTALLANMHVYWVMLPLLWALYRLLPRMLGDTSSGLYVWGGFAVLLLAPLISPYGLFQITSQPLDYFKNYFLLMEYADLPSVIRSTVYEFNSSFASQRGFVWVLLGYVMFIGWGMISSLLAGRLFVKDIAIKEGNPALPIVPAMIAAFGAVITAIAAVKYLPLFAILSLPYIGAISRDLKLSDFAFIKRIEKTALSVAFLPTLISFLAMAVVCFYLISAAIKNPWNIDKIKEIDSFVPFSLCQKLAALKIAPSLADRPVRILTHFNHGGWCKFGITLTNPALDWRVTTDNRTQDTPAEHFELSFDLFGLKGDWLNTLARWSPDVAVVYKRFPLATYMALAPQAWKMVMQDDNFAVFVPVK